jgi:hypothetical protein
MPDQTGQEREANMMLRVSKILIGMLPGFVLAVVLASLAHIQ